MTHFKRVGWDKTEGTQLQGYIKADYEDIVEVFGEPDDSEESKIQAEWLLIFEGEVVATIYDWKHYGIPVHTIKDWNIGGRSTLAVELVQKALGPLGETRGF